MAKLIVRIVLGLVSVAVTLFVALLAASYIFNASTNNRGKPVADLWTGKFAMADGVFTAYREWGTKGTPVVLIGGFLEPSLVWQDVGPRLAAEGHRVVALDLDGFGYTERTGPYTLAEWADQTAALMADLHLSDPIVVGHSLGAAVAVELVRRGLASHVVLVDGDARNDGGLPSYVRWLLVRSPFITSALRLSTDWDWPGRYVLANAYGSHHPPLKHSVIAAWTDQLRAVDADKALKAIIRHGVQGFTRSQLQAIRTHATVLWGTKDNVDPLSEGRQTVADLHAKLILVPGAGHMTPLTNPGAVTRAINAA